LRDRTTPFDDRDDAVLADGADARADAAALAPAFEGVAPELGALAADDVLGLGADAQDLALTGRSPTGRSCRA